MRAADRRRAVLERVLAGDGEVHGLSRRFGVSASTVRRDLERLVAEGRIARTYGGAVAGAGHLERSLAERETTRPAQKAAIARLAAELVGDGESVLLDAGSTIASLARELRGRSGLRVVTNSVPALVTLADAEDLELVVLGGRLRVLNQAMTGAMTAAALSGVTVDRAVLGGPAVHPRFGLAAPQEAHAALKAAMAERAREVVVLADSSKLGLDPGDWWTPLERPWTLVTDDGADPAAVETFSALPGVDVRVAAVRDGR
jgi:DeoR/GlpR family transcriptional regulator of sugar metabolism